VRTALAFLTPFGGARTPTPKSVRWFPAVGLVIGAGVGAVWRVGGAVWPAAVAAALAVIADLALTGMLHVDGLVDSADGLLPHLDRDRRLEVMAEPSVGAFGVTVAGAVLLARFVALSSIDADVWLVAGLWCLSRTAMVAVINSVPYARSSGLATAFQGEPHTPTVLFGSVLSCVLLSLAIGLPAAVVIGASWMAVLVMVWLAEARIGGYTGDVLGAVGVLAETVGLVVAAAKW
jgi:adenosylcobinamide-GDP ribazoletransferase